MLPRPRTKKPNKQRAEKASVAVVAAVISNTLLTKPVGKISVAAAQAAHGFISDWLHARQDRVFGKWLEGVLKGDTDLDPEIALAHLQAIGDDPIVQQVVLEAVRKLDEVICEAAVPAISKMTLIYLKEHRAADAFFRGTKRTLIELSTEEYSSLTWLLRTALSQKVMDAMDGLDIDTPGNDIRFTYEHTPQGRYELVFERLLPPRGFNIAPSAMSRLKIEGDYFHLLRLFHLLRINELGHPFQRGSLVSSSASNMLIVNIDTLRELLRIMT